eukprot:2910139-Pyramimonas_sp.AAC.1
MTWRARGNLLLVLRIYPRVRPFEGPRLLRGRTFIIWGAENFAVFQDVPTRGTVLTVVHSAKEEEEEFSIIYSIQ